MTSTALMVEIAAAAARLVVDEGMEYASAKRKAARMLARHQRQTSNLPSNEAVEEEVRAHLSLFCADTQPTELAALRRLALAWMNRLHAYRPHLGGAVWRGTATRLSSVRLDLYCDDTKALEIELINRRIDYRAASAPATGVGLRGEPSNVLSLATPCPELGESVTLHLAVHDLDDLRGALHRDAAGRSWRGDASALQRLLGEDTA